MSKYTENPPVVEAVEFTWATDRPVTLNSKFELPDGSFVQVFGAKSNEPHVAIGGAVANRGDFIVLHRDGSMSVIPSGQFKAWYAPVVDHDSHQS